MNFTLMPRTCHKTALQGAEARCNCCLNFDEQTWQHSYGCNWSARRQELAGAIIAHQFGELHTWQGHHPDQALAPSPRHLSGVTYYVYDVTVEFDAKPSVTFTLSLWCARDGPFR